MERNSSPKLNQRPIIGVVAQEFFQPTPERQTYIAASYVKFLEAAGARVAPILINKTDDEYKALFDSINGVLFPGGKATIFSTSGYGGVTKLLFQLAREANDRGDYFPVWGTCLGFQQMAHLIANKGVLTNTGAVGVALPLDFTQEATDSRMFKGFPADLLQALATEPLTTNIHNFSLTMKTYEELESLNTFYRVLTTNTYNGTTFISTMEAYEYPFYGVQWHPEKNQFEWSKPYVPHSPSAVRATYHCADFFVNEARKNLHSFRDPEEERKALIYNWTPTRTDEWTNWEQTYFFH